MRNLNNGSRRGSTRFTVAWFAVVPLLVGAAFFVFGGDLPGIAGKTLGEMFGFAGEKKPVYEIDINEEGIFFDAEPPVVAEGVKWDEGEDSSEPARPAVSPQRASDDGVPPKAEPKILISEILYDAMGSDTGKEFIELYNASDFDGDLSGWLIKRDGATIASIGSKNDDKKTIKSGGYFLIGLNGWIGPPVADAVRFAALPNSTATITIYDADGEIADSVTYSASCSGCALSAGQSYGRIYWDGEQFAPQSPSPLIK